MELGEFVRRTTRRGYRRSRGLTMLSKECAANFVCSTPSLRYPHHQLLVSRGDGSLIGPFSRLPDKTERVLSGKRPDRICQVE